MKKYRIERMKEGGGGDGRIETTCDNFNEKTMKEACPIGMKHA